jgi:hypothetical protein
MLMGYLKENNLKALTRIRFGQQIKKKVLIFFSMDKLYTNLYIKKACKETTLQSNRTGSEKKKCLMVTERCTRRLALTVGRIVMFLLSQTVQGLFTAVSATQNVDHPEDTKLIAKHLYFFNNSFFNGNKNNQL